MTKPVLFRLTKTMVKLIKVWKLGVGGGLTFYGILYKHTGNWGEVGGGVGGLTSTFYAFGIFYNFQFHSA